MPPLPSAGIRRRPWKTILIPGGIGVFVILCLVIVLCTAEPEPLSPGDILAKKEWDRDELTRALARSMAPAMTTQDRKKVMKHLSAQLKKLPRGEREGIRRAAVVATVTISLDQLRKMPSEERQSIIKTMERRARYTYLAVQQDPKKRRAFEKQLQSAEMEAFAKEVNRVIVSELTPAERVQFAPVSKMWIRTIKSVGR